MFRSAFGWFGRLQARPTFLKRPSHRVPLWPCCLLNHWVNRCFKSFMKALTSRIRAKKLYRSACRSSSGNSSKRLMTWSKPLLCPQLAQQHLVRRQGFRPLRHFHEDVEVYEHHAIRDDAHSAQGFVVQHPSDELFPLHIAQDEPSIHDAGNAVVVGDGVVLGHFQRGLLAHGWSVSGRPLSGKGFPTIDLSRCIRSHICFKQRHEDTI